MTELSKLPFESWVIPGIIAIALFGVGNIVAAISSFRKENNKSSLVSATMGGLLFISIVGVKSWQTLGLAIVLGICIGIGSLASFFVVKTIVRKEGGKF